MSVLLRGVALAAAVAVLPVGGVAQVTAPTPPQAAQSLPARLTDQEYWKFIIDMSETPGFFRSENLLSNETGYQMVIPSLLAGPRANKVYLGVGPEQNFTYIAALKPKMAIIFDIRKGNLLEHLLYKALFELSANRAEFIEKLFSKPPVKGLDTNSTAEAIAAAYWDVWGDSVAYRKNRDAVRDVLSKKHGFALTENDWIDLFWVYHQFYENGLPITYSSTGGGGGGGGGGGNNRMPTYRTLMEMNDGRGLNRGFLGTEANWRYLKDMHAKNLIVPVVGNFGGPKAIKAVGAWLKERGATVATFYASNVEQYLFQDGLAWSYYDNVATLPIDSASVFIRSGNSGGRNTFNGMGGMSAPNRMCSIQRLLEVNKAGRIGGYNDIFPLCEY